MESEQVSEELAQAERAISEGRYEAAEHLLDLAAHAGATPLHISNLGRALRAAKASHGRRVRGSVRVGFLIALAGYMLLSARQPLEWTMAVWLPLAFLLIPAIAGLFVGRRHAGERSPASAFFDGARSAIFAMACYSGLHVVILSDHLQPESSQVADEFVAGLLTVVMFSAIAGIVAGSVSAAASRRVPKRNSA